MQNKNRMQESLCTSPTSTLYEYSKEPRRDSHSVAIANTVFAQHKLKVDTVTITKRKMETVQYFFLSFCDFRSYFGFVEGVSRFLFYKQR